VAVVRVLVVVGLAVLVVAQVRAAQRRKRDVAELGPLPTKRVQRDQPLSWQEGLATPVSAELITTELYPPAATPAAAHDEMLAPRWALVEGMFVSVFDHRRSFSNGTPERTLSCARFQTTLSCPQVLLQAKGTDLVEDPIPENLHELAADNELSRSFRVLTADDAFATALLDARMVDYLLADARVRLFTLVGSDGVVAFDALAPYAIRPASDEDRGDVLARFATGAIAKIPDRVRSAYRA
jgi:hypothetical protein